MNKREIITKAKVMMWSYLVVFEALKIFGFDFGIRVENERLLTVFKYIDNNLFLCILIPSMLCILSTYIIYSMCIDKDYKYWKYLKIFIVLYSIGLTVSRYFSASFITILLSFIPILVLFKIVSDRYVVLRVLIVDSLFNFISLSIKSDWGMSGNIIETTIYSVDYYLMLILYKIGGFGKWQFLWELVSDYLAKKLKNLKDKFRNYKWKLSDVKIVDYGKRLKLEKPSLKNLKLKLRIWKMKLKLKSRDTAIPIITVYLIFLITVVLTDKGIESALFLIPYLAFRKSFNKTFHADYIPNIRADKIIQTCTMLSSLMFVIAISNLLPIEVSLFSGIVVAIALDCLLYVLKDWLDLRIENKELKEKHKENKFELTKDGIARIFKEFKTPEKYREYLTDVLIGGIKDTDYFSRAKEIIDEQQFRNYKYRFNKKLKTLDLL